MNSDLKRLSDEGLAGQTQAGSLPAFEELVFRYERRIYGFVAQSCGNSADAAEITQETFLRAFRAIGLYDPGRAVFAAWLFTIARRKCIDHHRAAPPPSEGPPPDRADPDDPAEMLARQDDRSRLWDLAHRILPEAQFQALWLRYSEEMNIEQIAGVLHRTRTHVKVMLFRARRALGRALEAAGADAPPRRFAATAAGQSSASDRRLPRATVKSWPLPSARAQATATAKPGLVPGT